MRPRGSLRRRIATAGAAVSLTLVGVQAGAPPAHAFIGEAGICVVSMGINFSAPPNLIGTGVSYSFSGGGTCVHSIDAVGQAPVSSTGFSGSGFGGTWGCAEYVSGSGSWAEGFSPVPPAPFSGSFLLDGVNEAVTIEVSAPGYLALLEMSANGSLPGCTGATSMNLTGIMLLADPPS